MYFLKSFKCVVWIIRITIRSNNLNLKYCTFARLVNWKCLHPWWFLTVKLLQTDLYVCRSSSHTVTKGVAYLREPWCASARRGARSCSHCPSRSLLPGPSGCWCHCTAAGSPSCQSPSARGCSWCWRWRKTHSTCSSDTGDREAAKLSMWTEGTGRRVAAGASGDRPPKTLPSYCWFVNRGQMMLWNTRSPHRCTHVL